GRRRTALGDTTGTTTSLLTAARSSRTARSLRTPSASRRSMMASSISARLAAMTGRAIRTSAIIRIHTGTGAVDTSPSPAASGARMGPCIPSPASSSSRLTISSLLIGNEQEGNRLAAGVDAELVVDVRDVGGDRPVADAQGVGDLPAGPPSGEHLQDLAFAPRETRHSRASPYRVGLIVLPDGAQKGSGHELGRCDEGGSALGHDGLL